MRIDTFYDDFRKNSINILFILEVCIAAVSFGLCLLLKHETILTDELALMLAFGFFVLSQIAITPFMINLITEPTKMIVDALTHVSHQASDVTPPSINQPRHERSGLKNIIQTIYELAIGSDHHLNVAAGNSKDLGNNAAFMQELLADLPCGVIALNKNRKVIFANKSAPTRINMQQELEINLPLRKLNEFYNWQAECEKTKIRDTRTWTAIENHGPNEQDHQTFDMIAHYQKAGNSAETLIVIVDRTKDHAPAQEDLDFLAIAAHELRGPITVIRGYIDVLNMELENKLLADQKELFGRLMVSSSRLSTYINNILNVSRYDRQHFKLHLYETDLSVIFAGLLDDVAMRAQTQNRVLTIRIPPGLPTIAADRNSISEVIVNFIDNAIKYSREGGQVIVGAEVKGDFVEVNVQDFGVGIPSSVIGNLFTKFYRSHRSRQMVSGTGLGLYISKAIVESHGGTVWVRSTEGQGSVFGFSVPVYATVADKLRASNNGNKEIIESSSGWIKNHAMYRG